MSKQELIGLCIDSLKVLDAEDDSKDRQTVRELLVQELSSIKKK